MPARLAVPDCFRRSIRSSYHIKLSTSTSCHSRVPSALMFLDSVCLIMQLSTNMADNCGNLHKISLLSTSLHFHYCGRCHGCHCHLVSQWQLIEFSSFLQYVSLLSWCSKRRFCRTYTTASAFCHKLPVSRVRWLFIKWDCAGYASSVAMTMLAQQVTGSCMADAVLHLLNSASSVSSLARGSRKC